MQHERYTRQLCFLCGVTRYMFQYRTSDLPLQKLVSLVNSVMIVCRCFHITRNEGVTRQICHQHTIRFTLTMMTSHAPILVFESCHTLTVNAIHSVQFNK